MIIFEVIEALSTNNEHALILYNKQELKDLHLLGT